ncbi:MAG: GntR family transcriptional regulator [Pseudanabaena sp.]|jgi:DNA-binding GntR family transcriptional regulator|uniref:GntR family transcriptional regulator n=1 Tax=Pseudanabaena mucicola TaxID=71190 RepID=UPI0025758C64|nr:GntR family transcriptional regulator [Pseudanabaena mucicola]MCA6574197.1 GntR family transcriptional regulator [Pseudanabaena sp. M53BS1SP1A06MG]MCA6583781.1 GntR family transcriptional regulator [Pseudanabaena sp. M34BS1SP1A06MG]MCA6585150.1 GntR family transcriptional regulator [Pseudanabaena sp. M051S1SP1A06QC]MCA6588193.1 GntR family transcriptional regulator [Pseudanabaena sp. M109S1SP1A06QC]MCA6593341.1 GntR family transcriptional regulator [Pseudanabaena sp. M38BS1SP1A06MG]MCA6599
MFSSSAPIQRPQSLREQTYQVLRASILSGELGAGSRLVEAQIAEKLQVSRTPIREALQQLQKEQLIVTDKNGNLRVISFSPEDARHLYRCRLALEQESVLEACQYATTEQLAKLELIIHQAEKAITQKNNQLTSYQLLHIDYQFHRVIAECSGNPWLALLLDQLFDKMALLRIQTIQQNLQVLEIRTEHHQIFAAIAQRNSEQALTAIRNHLTASQNRVILELERFILNSPLQK